MRKLFERTVRTAVAMELVDLAVQAVDGTKVVANASVNRSYDAEGLRGLLDRLERAITDLETQNEAGEEAAVARLPEKLADKEVLREQVKHAMADLASQKRHRRINLTDPEASALLTSDWDIAAPFMRYSTLTSGAHTTLRLSGFLPLSRVPLSLTVYNHYTHPDIRQSCLRLLPGALTRRRSLMMNRLREQSPSRPV